MWLHTHTHISDYWDGPYYIRARPKIKDQGSNKIEIDKAIHKLNFNKQRNKLNNILLSQYLISNGHKINQADLQQIQNTDRSVNALKQNCLKGHQGYVLKYDVLYKKK